MATASSSRGRPRWWRPVDWAKRLGRQSLAWLAYCVPRDALKARRWSFNVSLMGWATFSAAWISVWLDSPAFALMLLTVFYLALSQVIAAVAASTRN